MNLLSPTLFQSQYDLILATKLTVTSKNFIFQSQYDLILARYHRLDILNLLLFQSQYDLILAITSKLILVKFQCHYDLILAYH